MRLILIQKQLFLPCRLRSDKCGCGLLQTEHHENVLSDLKGTWESLSCTKPKRTTCYGELEFVSDTSNYKMKKNVNIFIFLYYIVKKIFI